MSSTTVPAIAWRKSRQPLLPLAKPAVEPGRYDLYPTFHLQDEAGDGICVGFAALAEAIAARAASVGGLVLLDGFGGLFWSDVRERLAQAFEILGLSTAWHDTAGALRPPEELDAALAPFLGGDDPLFGRRHTGTLADLFDSAALAAFEPETGADLNLIYGSGAALTGLPGLLVYLDLPKSEIQYRSRAGSIAPLGAAGSISADDGAVVHGTPAALDPKQAYKRFFFVDWPLLADHKRQLLPRIDLFVDSQRPDTPVFVSGQALRATLENMSASPLRARPWFEAGPWGGQWMKRHIPGLPDDEVNLAWSFELITPENGLLLHDGHTMLEVSFDLLMFHAQEAVLGEAAGRFGHHFPIRFNYLDTVGGGNLSVQVHPSDAYARSRFGEGFTQDECYYVSDTVPAAGTDGAVIYLGLRDGVDPAEFRAALETSLATGEELDVQRFVNSVPAKKHGLYLIPNGTVHSSGDGSLVLEISATPYLYTFKMYDWQRLDLDGKPRPMNLERAFDNIDFGRTPDVIEREHVAPELLLEEGEDWRLVHLPTHPQHFYDVHRLEFGSEVEVDTGNACHVLNLVEGSRVSVRSQNGVQLDLAYAETVVLPAAAGRYTLSNMGGGRVMVVKAFVKPGRGRYDPGG